jgi:hypothetical protein
VSKAQYDIYLRKVLDLAHTLVIKSRASADAINTSLVEKGLEVSDNDPTTWKYYLNLAGRYHATDRLMQVTSLDTLQTIDFTRENLQDHRTTYREYAFGSRFYNELVNRFPEQEMLIRGILDPVDMATAIAAPDGRILHHEASLVEDNETNLIPQLSHWCEAFMVRWNVPAFTHTDSLYAASQLAVLFQQIPLKILNIRLANCHTPYAHSFHIREYLASNGRLDVYVDHLNKAQMLWLYRNIKYLHRNAGKHATFELLVENILTKRGLPLAEWSMRHNLRDQLAEVYPDIEFARRQLNLGAHSAGSDTATVTELLNKEQPAAKGNPRVQPEAEQVITRTMENSISNRLSTKVLESSVLDMTDATVYTRSDCLLNHWLYLAAADQYKAVVVVENPKTGDTLTLTARDAFVVFIYAYNKARGLTLPNIPMFDAQFVRRQPTPSKAKLQSLVEARLVSDEIINAALDALTPLKSYISTIAFYEAMLQVHATQLFHRALYVTQEHMHARAQVEVLVSHLYADIPCDIDAGQSYATWFAERGLDIPTFTTLEADLLATSLLSAATGADLKATQSLKEMQAAMLRLMAQLSSYSVQYLQSINSDPIRVVEWPAIRVGDEHVKGGDYVPVDMLDVRVQQLYASIRERLRANLDEIAPETTTFTSVAHHTSTDVRLVERTVDKDVVRVRIPMEPVRVLKEIEVISRVADVNDQTTENYVPIDRTGLEGAFLGLVSPHYALTASERQLLLDRWQSWNSRLTGQLPVNQLPGLEYPPLVDVIDTELDGLDYPTDGGG